MNDAERTERNVEVVLRHYQYSNDGDWSRIEEQFADDVTLEEASGHPFPGVFRGKQALREGGAGVVESLGLTNVRPVSMMSNRDSVAALIEITVGGKNRDPFTHEVVELWTLNEAGKITAIRPFYHDLTALRAGLGLD
jgi:ketosteroid isomerase-like protein